MGLRVQPDAGPPFEFLEGGSRLTLDEDPRALVVAAITRLRASNRAAPARPKSIALTALEDAQLWLHAYERGEVR